MASALAVRTLVAQRRTLPTIHDIRHFSPAELEFARLDLQAALELVPPFVESTEPRRGELLRLLASAQIRLGNPLDAEGLLEDARGSRHALKPNGVNERVRPPHSPRPGLSRHRGSLRGDEGRASRWRERTTRDELSPRPLLSKERPGREGMDIFQSGDRRGAVALARALPHRAATGAAGRV